MIPPRRPRQDSNRTRNAKRRPWSGTYVTRRYRFAQHVCEVMFACVKMVFGRQTRLTNGLKEDWLSLTCGRSLLIHKLLASVDDRQTSNLSSYSDLDVGKYCIITPVSSMNIEENNVMMNEKEALLEFIHKSRWHPALWKEDIRCYQLFRRY